jgi:hypothetical protein
VNGEKMTEQEREHKYRKQNGETPDYKAYLEVHITKISGSTTNEEIAEFANKTIAQYKGHIEEQAGIPVMLFERNQDAMSFVNELHAKFRIPKEHMTIKAQKFTR